jgi:soluble lytic murein transglycosylase-like protein
MDSTARMLGVRDVFDPEENVRAGARYLRQLLEEFGSLPLALAAYNAGPARVRSAGGIPPFAETRSYVERVVQLYRQWAL